MGNDRLLENLQNRPRTKLRWWLAGTCLIVLTVAVFSILRARREQREIRAKIQAKLSALKASGQPVTEADLARLCPDPKPAEDAGLLLAKSLALVVQPPTKSFLPFVGGPVRPAPSWQMDEATKRELVEFLKANQDALEALPLSLPAEARFAREFAKGFANPPDLPVVELRRLFHLLALNAIHQGECGQAEDAARSIESQFRICRTIWSHGLVGYLVGRAGEDLACGALERTLNKVVLPEARLLALSNVAAQAQSDGLEITMRIERCRGIWLFESLRNPAQSLSSNPPPVLTLLGNLLARRDACDADYLRYLDSTDAYLAALRLSIPERLRKTAQLDKDARREPRGAALALASIEWSRPMRLETEAQAQLLVVQAALAVERFRLAQGNKLPQSLADLVPVYLPSVPLDPFTAKALRYELRRTGYVIYSVGADGSDDNGAVKPSPDTEGQRYDLPFAIER